MPKDESDDGPESEQPVEDDLGLFRRSMQDTRPMQVKLTAPAPQRAVPRARFRAADERQVLRESLESGIDDAESQSGQALRFHRPSVGRRTMRKLARGNFSVQGEIDLHGMTVSEASIALRDFINESCLRGHSCVRIVHGKGLGSGRGGPVLKGKVDIWLRRWEQVLAFVSARQVDGGTGAVYVLLDISH